MRVRLTVLSIALLGSLVALANRSSLQAWAFGIGGGGLEDGKAAPELPKLATLDGARVELAKLRGRVILLHFWTFG
jgi:hypothetical protein